MMHLAPFEPAALPSLPVNRRCELPTTPAIYFVLAAGGWILYIGKARSLRQRWSAHHRLAQLREYGACRIAWMEVNDVTLLDELERACIEHFSPVLNGDPVPGGARLTAPGEIWLTSRVSKETKAALEEWAHKTRRSVSYLLRRLAEEAIEQGRAERGEQI